MYYPCSENKDADQLRGYRKADLRLCFRPCKLLVFSRTGSNGILQEQHSRPHGNYMDYKMKYKNYINFSTIPSFLNRKFQGTIL